MKVLSHVNREVIWMYGFPSRRHHTDRAFARRQSSLDRYNGAEAKFYENHTFSAYSPVKGLHSPIKPRSSAGKLPSVSPAKVAAKPEVLINGRLSSSSGHDRFEGSSTIADQSCSYIGSPRYRQHGVTYSDWKQQQYYGRQERRPSYYGSYNEMTWPAEYVEDIEYETPERVYVPTYPSRSCGSSPLVEGKARFDVIEATVQAQRVKLLAAAVSNADVAIEEEHVDSATLFGPVSLLDAIKSDDFATAYKMLELRVWDGINETDRSGRTALSYAVLKGDPVLERLLKVPHVDVNKADNEGNTPLHFAVQAGQTDAVSILLNFCSSGLDINVRNEFGFTPLMKAALQGRTKCAKMLLFAGASPTMRDTGRGLRAEQWARLCGRYVCADVIEKYARNELLSKSTSYGGWGCEPELGLHFVNGKLQLPQVSLQNAANRNYQNGGGIKSKLKKAFASNNSKCVSKISSFSLVSQLTSAALCVSSPVLPNSSQIPPVVKSILKPFVIPRIEITPCEEETVDQISTGSSVEEKLDETQSVATAATTSSTSSSDRSESRLSYRRLSSLVKFEKFRKK